MSAATSEATRAAANENVAVSARPPLPAIEATIIDIPSAFSTSCASPSSSSASSSSYDTDCSTASSTCCAHHGEHVYMQRSVAAAASAGVGIGVCIDAAPTQCSEVELDVDVDGDAEAEAEADVELRQFKAEQRRSWPFFMLAISLIEIGVFVFDYMTVKPQPELHAPIPTDSVLIYRPDRRQQLWRFVSYMVLHANWFHLSFNVVVQLLFGVPLEVMHGSARIAVIYLAGVFAGSLGTSVVDSEVYLVGASGGVYALLAAHLANIVLNYGQMRYAVAQLVSVLIFVSCDLGYAVYTQYLDVSHFSEAPAVSYIAHLTGALAGLTIGLLVLKNFERKAHENLIWWLALGVWTAFTIFAIVFNLINTVTAQLMEEQGEVITQHLLHDLGVS